MPAQNKNSDFFLQLKSDSERLWQDIPLRRDIYGFQIQAGTKWLPGLSDAEIDAYESDLGFRFPQIYRDFLSCMNGTDIETINLYGESGHPYAYGPGYYSYPRDLAQVKERIVWIYEAFGIAEEEVQARSIPHILPVVAHRFLMADNFASNPVLSMHGSDVILYAADLTSFLVNDILHSHARDKDLSVDFPINFWLER